MSYYRIKVNSANRISAQSISLKDDSKDEPQNIAEKKLLMLPKGTWEEYASPEKLWPQGTSAENIFCLDVSGCPCTNGTGRTSPSALLHCTHSVIQNTQQLAGVQKLLGYISTSMSVHKLPQLTVTEN